MANALNVEFVVVESGSHSDVTLVSPDSTDENTQQVFLGHVGQHHFVSVTDFNGDINELCENQQQPEAGRQSQPQQTATWGESCEDGLVISNSCPLDGPLTFLTMLVKTVKSIARLFHVLGNFDEIVTLLMLVVSLCSKGKWGEGKLKWLVETRQVDASHQSNRQRVNCWGSEGVRFFEHLQRSALAAVSGTVVSTCDNPTCVKRKIVKERKTVSLL